MRPALIEKKSTDENQSPSTADLVPDQDEFNHWLAEARESDDVRDRIAVAGGNLSMGRFGKCYLLVADKPPMEMHSCGSLVSGCVHREAANDSTYDQVTEQSTVVASQ